MQDGGARSQGEGNAERRALWHIQPSLPRTQARKGGQVEMWGPFYPYTSETVCPVTLASPEASTQDQGAARGLSFPPFP